MLAAIRELNKNYLLHKQNHIEVQLFATDRDLCLRWAEARELKLAEEIFWLSVRSRLPIKANYYLEISFDKHGELWYGPETRRGQALPPGVQIKSHRI